MLLLLAALFLLAAEGEVHTGEVLEVVLVAGVVGAVHTKAGVEVVHLNRPQLDVRGQGVIQTTAEFHREGIVVAAGGSDAVNAVVDVAIRIAMRGSEQSLAERLELARVLLDLRAEHVSEYVAVDIGRGEAVAGELVLQPAALGLAVEIGLNADPRSHVVHKSAAATEDVEAGDRA